MIERQLVTPAVGQALPSWFPKAPAPSSAQGKRDPILAGSRIVVDVEPEQESFGMDALSVSGRKWGGRDGIAVRAFENAIFYVFANSVGPQGGGKWSAGDSKIVAPDGRVLRLADNENEAILVADLDLALATRKYALDSLEHPRFLARRWREIVGQAVCQSKSEGGLLLPSQERRADSQDS